MILELDGRCAVITGAASGIGRALAREAHRRRMDLALFDVDGAGLKEVEADLTKRGARVVARQGSVADRDDVQRFANDVFRAYKSVALVFANAGLMRIDSTIRPDLAVWDLTIDVNLRGPVNCIAAFVGAMVDRKEPAQFVITGSQGSFIAAPEIAAYTATKHAVWALAESLQSELAVQESPVRVSLLAPGRVRTKITEMKAHVIRTEQSDQAAKAYEALLMAPDIIATRTFARVVEQPFWILPTVDYKKLLTDRLQPLLEEPDRWPG
jgi:NAD(P)-dependent dehydrogenase (short-subunit alcohol dehydrogenase family)